MKNLKIRNKTIVIALNIVFFLLPQLFVFLMGWLCEKNIQLAKYSMFYVVIYAVGVGWFIYFLIQTIKTFKKTGGNE